MKIGFLLFFVVILSLAVDAQKEQDGRCIIEKQMASKLVKVSDQIGDFTITDSDGITWNLYEQLNQGKTVFIDLFFST
jgi:cytochrome oxidase Cu insertion factor (SCO1/SenC/PrrC family)